MNQPALRPAQRPSHARHAQPCEGVRRPRDPWRARRPCEASFGSSRTFVALFAGATLVVLEAPFIVMSQNRQASRDRINAAHGDEVNLKADPETRRPHDKIDPLRKEQWGDCWRRRASN